MEESNKDDINIEKQEENVDLKAAGEREDISSETSNVASNNSQAADDNLIDEFEKHRIMDNIVIAMKSVYDPEIPVDIYELGLIYNVEIFDNRNVMILMTLTAPNCPVAGDIISWVHNAVSEVSGVKEVEVELTFDPPWDMSQMSDEARVELNLL